MPQRTQNALHTQVQHLEQAVLKLALVQSQWESVEQADYETVQAILKQKQHFIDQLSIRETIFQAVEALPISGQQDESQFMKAAVQRMKQQLNAIATQEQATRQLMETRREETSQQLRDINQSQKASKPYSQAKTVPQKSRLDISS